MYSPRRNFYGGKRGASPAQLAIARAARGKSPAKNCRWNSKTLRCRRSPSGGVAGNCRINRKGHCVKKSSSPRKSASPAQLVALAKGRATRARNIAARKGVPPPAPKMPDAPRNTHKDTVALSAALEEAQCVRQTNANSCNKAVNCSWTEEHQKKNRKGETITVAGKCGHHRGRTANLDRQGDKVGRVVKSRQ